MALLYQHEKSLLLQLARHYEERSSYCQTRAMIRGANKKMYLEQMEKELEKAKILRKAAS